MNNTHIPGKMYSLSELQTFELGKSTKPLSLQLNGSIFAVKNWARLMESLLSFLVAEGCLHHHQIPISNHAEGDKYLINRERRHKIAERDGLWKQVDNFYVDVKYNAEAHRKNIIHLSTVLGLRGRVKIKIAFH